MKDIIEEYNELNEYDHDSIIEFIDKNFDLIINFKSDTALENEDYSILIRNYFDSLFETGQYSKIIDQIESARSFFNQFDTKSNILKRNYIDIEFTYVLALDQKFESPQLCITKLHELKSLDPTNENIDHTLSNIKTQLKINKFKIMQAAGITLAISFMIIGHFSNEIIISYIELAGFSIFLFGFVMINLFLKRST